MKNTLLALAFAASAFLASAADKIEGAVGVKLGQPFPSTLAASTNAVGGEPYLAYSPTNAAAPFREYLFFTHPEDGRVYSISAYAELETEEEAAAEWAKIKLLLTAKYGSPSNDNDPRKARWVADSRFIALIRAPGTVISLMYVDVPLSKEAKRLRTEHKAKETDASGL